MLDMAIPQTPGPERVFFQALRTEFLAMVKEVSAAISSFIKEVAVVVILTSTSPLPGQSSDVMVFDMNEGRGRGGSGGGSLQDSFAHRKKSGLSDEELKKRHRRVSLLLHPAPPCQHTRPRLGQSTRTHSCAVIPAIFRRRKGR